MFKHLIIYRLGAERALDVAESLGGEIRLSVD